MSKPILGRNSWLDFGLYSFALSRRKQGFESPRERQRNQILGTNNFAGVQRMSNKRVRTTMHSHGKFRGAGATLNSK